MNLETDDVYIRKLRPSDLNAVILLDAMHTGRRREEYFRVKLAQAIADTGIQASLAAEIDGVYVGFLLARVYYGEFGKTEKVAVLDTIDVNPDFIGRGVGSALLRQLRENLLGLGIQQLQTEIAWQDARLMSFFNHAGFEPAARFCLDLDLAKSRKTEELETARTAEL